MSTLNVAIIGCGSIFKNHAMALMNMEGVKFHTFCDIKLDRALSAAEEFGGKAASDFNEVVKNNEIDVVHICTPHYLHAPMAIEALKHGKHVLVEKPLAMDSKEAEKVIKAAEESDRHIGICFQNRYNENSVRIKKLLDSKEAGAILGARAFVTWHREGKYYTESDWRGKWSTEGGGVLINQSIHTIDLLQWFVGEVESVSGSTATRKLADIIEVEDTAEGFIKFKNGASGLFFASNCYAVNAPISIEIACENAVIRLEDDLVIKWKDGKVESFSETSKTTGEKAYWGLGHSKLINDFYNSINTGRDFSIAPKEAAVATRIIDGIRGRI